MYLSVICSFYCSYEMAFVNMGYPKANVACYGNTSCLFFSHGICIACLIITSRFTTCALCPCLFNPFYFGDYLSDVLPSSCPSEPMFLIITEIWDDNIWALFLSLLKDSTAFKETALGILEAQPTCVTLKKPLTSFYMWTFMRTRALYKWRKVTSEVNLSF